MGTFRKIILFFILTTNLISAQNSKLFGKIINAETNEPLAAVNIILANEQISTTTNRLGEYSIENLPPKHYKIIVSHIGYKSVEKEFYIKENSVNEENFILTPIAIKLGEVKVTSTKYVKLEKDVAIPLEVVEENEINKLPDFTPADVLKNESGITIERDGIWATTVNIRGLSRDNVVTLIDGNRIETATNLSAGLSLIDLNDVERIEVIKGAASSIYGTGALGGIVNIISKDAGFNNGFSFNGNLSSGYNSVNNSYTGNIILKANDENWFAKVNTTYRRADDTETPRGTLSNSQFRDNNISVVAGVKPFENQELKFSYQRFYGEDIGIPGGNSLFPGNAEIKYPFEKRNLFSGEYIVKSPLPSLSKISLKYFNQNIYRDVENIPHIVNIIPAGNGQPGKRITVEKILPNARHYVNGIQLQTNWFLGRSHLVVAGIDAWQRKLDSRRERQLKIEVLDSSGNTTNTINQRIGERPLPESDYTSLGFYAQDEFRIISDKLTLTIGGRIDQIKITNKAVSNPVYIISNGTRNDNPSDQKINWIARKEDDFSWSGNLSLIYSIFNDINFTFTAGRSFRSPTLEERYQYIDLGNLIRLGDPNLNPEKGYFFDTGIKIYKSNFSLTANGFINLLTDLVVEKPGSFEGRPALINSNIGKAALYGFDFGFEINSYKNFIIYGNSAYVIGKDTHNEKYLPQIPPFNGTLGIRSPMFEFFNFDISSTFFAVQSNVAEGEITTPGYVYYNLYLGSKAFQLGLLNFKIFAGIENIFNKAYRNHLSTNRGLISSEPGRNFFAKLNIEW